MSDSGASTATVASKHGRSQTNSNPPGASKKQRKHPPSAASKSPMPGTPGSTTTAAVTALTSQANVKATTFGGRTKVRATHTNRRPVYKPTLDSPYNIYWPTTPESMQTTAIQQLCQLVASIGEYRKTKSRHDMYMKRPFDANKSKTVKDRAQRQATAPSDKGTAKVPERAPPPPAPEPRPSLLAGLCIGLSAVTRVLERDARRRAAHLLPTSDAANGPATDRPLLALFVCKADMVPAHMSAHLPLLAYRAGRVPIVTLPEGAERRLAAALQMRRVSVVGVYAPPPDATPLPEALQALCHAAIAAVHTPAMPWLDIKLNTPDAASRAGYQQVRIKRLATIMPIRPKNNNSSNKK